MKNGKKIKISMDFNKYVVEDLDNDLEAIFADMMDDGFEVKKRTKELPLVDVIMTRRTGTGFSFNIMPYKEHIKQLFDILERKGIQFIYGLVYLEGTSVMINEVDSILLYNDPDFTDFRGKTWEERQRQGGMVAKEMVEINIQQLKLFPSE
jgi:hypothetical protein